MKKLFTGLLILSGFLTITINPAFAAGGGGGGSCTWSDDTDNPTSLGDAAIGTTYAMDISGCSVPADYCDGAYNVCDDASANGGYYTNGGCYGEIMMLICSIGLCSGSCGGSAENDMGGEFCPSTTGDYTVDIANISCSGGGASLQYAMFPVAQSNTDPTSCSTGELFCSGSATANQSYSVSLTGGQCYYIMFDGNAQAACTFDFTISQVLPVELAWFDVKKEGDNVKLEWQTASEKDVNYFGVYRSGDGSRFDEIAQVNAKGNSTKLTSYSYIDNQSLPGVNYYRLKSVDFDGTFKYSNISSIKNDNVISVNSFYFNQNKINTTYFTSERSEAFIHIINASGQRVFDKNIKTQKGANYLDLDITELSPGLYFFVLNTADGNSIKRKFIKY